MVSAEQRGREQMAMLSPHIEKAQRRANHTDDATWLALAQQVRRVTSSAARLVHSLPSSDEVIASVFR
jgi:hypothetical protein